MKVIYFFIITIIFLNTFNCKKQKECPRNKYKFSVYTKTKFYKSEEFIIKVNDKYELEKKFPLNYERERFDPLLECCLENSEIKIYFKANGRDTIVLLSPPDTSKLFLGTKDDGTLLIGKSSDEEAWLVY